MPQAVSKPQWALNDAVEKVRNVAPSDFGWKQDISPSQDLDKELFDKGEKAVFNSLEKVVFEKEQNFHKYCDMMEEKIRKSKRKLGI